MVFRADITSKQQLLQPLMTTVVYFALFVAGIHQAYASEYKVSSQAELDGIIDALVPGDEVLLAAGVWSSVELRFRGRGTAAQPIVLSAEEPGKVILSGRSNLTLVGEHLVVRDLIFRDGYTPTSSVISFGDAAGARANYSRVTNVVIDRFNNPERSETDYWVTIYGKHNRFDHNHLEGKSNRGVTLAVKLTTEADRENYHSIDHNYFGPRPTLGSNGGETIRIGTSHYSLFDSKTVVERNYFDRCSGEVEIISIKSGANRISDNIFYESQGAVTLRHGNGNVVERNAFFGNRVAHTGGVRVINADQTVRNNYFEGLKGYRFGGALVVMNGVPDSPINRYHQVVNAQIYNNTFVDSDHVQLAAGNDSERSAHPVDSQMRDNLFVHSKGREIISAFGNVSGITFLDNVQNFESEFARAYGFKIKPINLKRRPDGVSYPTGDSLEKFGISGVLALPAKSEVGVSWFAKREQFIPFGSGREVTISPGLDAIADAVAKSQPGDRILLKPGIYTESKVVHIRHPISLVGQEGGSQASILFERAALFELNEGGSLQLSDLTIDGTLAPDAAGNSVVRTQRSSMPSNYRFWMERVTVKHLSVNHSFNFMSVSPSTFADHIVIKQSHFSDITGAVLKLDAQQQDLGIYNAENVEVLENHFRGISGPIVAIYRGGTDESTFGPHFDFANNTVLNSGFGKRNKEQASVLLHGVQVSTISNNVFIASRPVNVRHTVGEPRTIISENLFRATLPPLISELLGDDGHTAVLDRNVYED